jgi:hypothetical protein
MAFILHTTGPVQIGGTGIGGIKNVGSHLGSQVKGEPSSGEIYSRLMAVYGQKPTLSFTAEDIQGALNACGPTGVSLATKTLTLYGSKILAGGGIDTSGHLSLAASLGLLFPKTLSVAHQGDATISYDAMLYSNNDADPFTLTVGGALPAIPAFQKWTLCSVTMGGVTINQNMHVNVDFGVRCFGEGADSNIRDELVAIQSIEPKITVTSSNNGKIFDLLGASGAFSIVLRNRAVGGGFGSSRITLAATSGLAMQDTPFQASGHRPGDLSLSGHIFWDGSTAPLTVS